MEDDTFADVYRRYIDRIYRYILIRVGDVQDAQDITAQTFYSALKGFQRYRGNSNGITAWLFAIARKKIADHYRRSRPQVALDDIGEIASALSLDEIVSGRLTVQRVHAALQELPPDRAEALMLHIFGGLSYAQVGEVMERSEPAAKMLAHRALTELRQQLGYLVEE
jgi:RNA polymerase sigma-70 factor (ECF subfamily)